MAEVEAVATRIRKIHVSDQGRFGLHGSTLPNRASTPWVMWSRIARWERRCGPAPCGWAALEYSVPLKSRGSKAASTRFHWESNKTGVERGGATAIIGAKLVVAADGVQSAVRGAFGVDADTRDYGQTAVITTVLPQRFHEHVAYERFTDSGPLALLPLEGGRCTLVLTLSHATAQAPLRWSDAEFLAEVQRRFGFRLGRFLKVGRRVAYPLSLTRAASAPARDAASSSAMRHRVCIRWPAWASTWDCAISRAWRNSSPSGAVNRDSMPGPQACWPHTMQWRAADRRGVIAFTDGLVRMFANPLGVVRRLRNVGLLAFDLLPPAKAALSRLSTGAGARVPKLARGVALQ
jgi:2-octaprenyl-6-methoxyphenol hydroxylase